MAAMGLVGKGLGADAGDVSVDGGSISGWVYLGFKEVGGSE
jgi:hypothetical protein